MLLLVVFAAATLVAGRAAEGAACSREGGGGGGGRSGACLFLRFPPSTDTLAAFSSTPLSVPISADGEDVEEDVELLRWIRNCSARSRNSFLVIQLIMMANSVSKMLRSFAHLICLRTSACGRNIHISPNLKIDCLHAVSGI